MDNGLQYTITVDDEPAVKGTQRVNKAFDGVGERAASTALVAAGAFNSLTSAIVQTGRSAEHATVTFAGFAAKAIEAGTAIAGSVSLAAQALAHYGAVAVQSSGGFDQLASSFRAARLAASAAFPEIFGSLALTATTVGIGLLIEETVRLTNARGKLIEQQALLAATSSLSVGGSSVGTSGILRQIEATTQAAALSGGSAPAIHGLQSALSSQFESDPSGTKAALGTLGVSNYYAGYPSIDALQKIAEGFANISDPAQRASAAVALFGKDNAGLALQQLGYKFATGAQAVKDFGLTLDDTSRRQIYEFHRQIEEAKNVLTDFTVFEAFGAKIKQSFEVGTASALDFIENGLHAVGRAFDQIPGLRAARQFVSGKSDAQIKAEGDQDLKYGSGAITGYLPARDALLAATNKGTADALVAEAIAAQKDRAATPEGIKAALSAAQSRRDAAAIALAEAQSGKKPLTDAQRELFASQYIGDSQLSTSLKASVDAADLSKEIGRKQQDALRNSRELVVQSEINPSAGRNLRGEILKDTTFVDKDGTLQTFTLLDETRRNLAIAFHAYTVDLNRKASAEQIKLEEESFERRKKFEEQIFQRRQDFERQTLELAVATDEKIYDHQNTLAGYSRDERLGALAGQRPQTVSGKLALEQNKLGIESDYLLTAAVNDADKVSRNRDRQLSDLASQRYSNKITDAEYFDRYKTIQDAAGNAGTEINDKYAHDLITAQQTAATASTQIVRDAQLKQFDSLKSSVEGVLQATESRGVNVFQAIGNAAKSALLGAFNQIISSQIAASLFRVLNPGQTVEFDANGQGKGKFGGILGGLGLGTQPVFGGALPKAETKLDLPNHVGDVSLVNGAIPVVLANGPQGQSSGGGRPGFVPSVGISALSSLAALLSPGLAFAGPQLIDRTGGSAVDTSINYDGGGAESFSSLNPGAVSGTESLGIPGGYGLSLPGVTGKSGGGLSGLSGLKGLIYNSGEIQVGPGVASSAAGISQSLGGGALGGLAGDAAGFASSPAGGALGSAVLLDGLHRKPGVASAVETTGGGSLLGANIGAQIPGLGVVGGAIVGAGAGLAIDGLRRGGFKGTLETTAGGAAIGYQFGGPIGAAVGAAVGLGVGLLREFVFKGPKQDIKDSIKQIYGIEVNDSFAEQVIALAKQSYGGDWHVAIRSQQVRDLLKLYAETIGSSAQKQFVNDSIHSASLVESGGKLTQGAVYDNGQAYTYAGSLPTLGGISSSPLPTVARGAGSGQNVAPIIQLNQQQTVDLWKSGTTQAIQDNPRLVASSAVNGYQQSASRSGNATSVLAPSAIQQ